MCLYDPPLLLGMPDLSAAVICALPLAASAGRWSEVLSAFVGLVLAFLAAHSFIIAWHHQYPPSFFYRVREQGSVVPFSFAILAFEMTLLYSLSRFVRGLWRAEYAQAVGYLLLLLSLLAGAIGAFACLATDARALEVSFPTLLANNAVQPETADQESIIPASCVFPPFGEGFPGYLMLAALVIFQILVAVGVQNALKRMPAAS